jgi:hypothetical protein
MSCARGEGWKRPPSGRIYLFKLMASETPISLIIDSKHYLAQNANNLTVNLDKELSNIESIKLVYAGMSCTFYNITSKIGNKFSGQ